MKKNYLNSILAKIQKYRNQCRDCTKLINKGYRTMKKDKIKIGRKKYENLKRIYDNDHRERNREKVQLYKKN